MAVYLENMLIVFSCIIVPQRGMAVILKIRHIIFIYCCVPEGHEGLSFSPSNMIQPAKIIIQH